jgi:hypothetical protein
MSTGTLREPLATWNANDPGWADWRYRGEASAWAKEHLPDADSTWRAEFFLVDAPFAVVYEFATDDEGRVRYDPAQRCPVMAEPATVILDSLPPAHLLEG